VKYGDNEPPPWDIQDTLGALIKEVSVLRKIEGQKWIERFKVMENSIATMQVKEADSLMVRLQSPPPVLTDDQKERANHIAKKAKARCQELEIDWMVQKFIGLSLESKNFF
jgi:hypothetical protein